MAMLGKRNLNLECNRTALFRLKMHKKDWLNVNECFHKGFDPNHFCRLRIRCKNSQLYWRKNMSINLKNKNFQSFFGPSHHQDFRACSYNKIFQTKKIIELEFATKVIDRRSPVKVLENIEIKKRNLWTSIAFSALFGQSSSRSYEIH